MLDDDYKRPSPEAMLQLAQKLESESERGKLTIYLGAAPGVGKTYAMLNDARQILHHGVDVVAGYIEAHGRTETEDLLEGMEILPPQEISYKGMKLKELNLEAALKRRPQLILVDEMAHTNAPGAQHAKRFQDIEELLNAGIDVFTTLNVQHLESLNDIVYQILFIHVKETVPDTLIKSAYEIKLIDLPPEELLKRLDEGKVYVKNIVGLAVDKFFRPGNLMALRQMALRVVANTVDKEMVSYMKAHAIAGPWPAQERILVGVLASPSAEMLVRSAFRLANEKGAEWIALHVETQDTPNYSPREKEWLKKAMELAGKLGARLVWQKGDEVAEEIADYAQKNNVTMLVMGKPRKFGRNKSLTQKLVERTPKIDIYLFDNSDQNITPQPRKLVLKRPLNYLLSLLLVVVTSLAVFPFKNGMDQINLFSLLFLPVILSAIFMGRGPSFLAALASILIFDFLFVPPHFTLIIADPEYFISFVVYLVVILVIGNLASRLRVKVEQLRKSEAMNIAIHGLSRDLVTAHNLDQALAIVIRHTREIFNCEMAVFLPQGDALEVKAKTPDFEVSPHTLGIASWVLLNRKPAGRGTDTLPEAKAYYLPMREKDRTLGVMGLIFKDPELLKGPDNRLILDTIARLGGIAIERITSFVCEPVKKES